MSVTLNGYTAQGRDRLLALVAETTYGVLVHPSAGDFIPFTAANIGSPVPTRHERDDVRASRSLEEHYTGNTPPIPFSIESYIIPSGTAGTPPDAHDLFLAAMGTYANTPATSDIYTLSDTAQGLNSLSLLEWSGRIGAASANGFIMSQFLSGCLVDEMTLSGSGGDAPKVSFAGWGAYYALTGRSQLTGAFAAAVGSVDDVENFRADIGPSGTKGSLVAIYETADGVTVVDSNSGAGFNVDSISGSALTLSGSPAGTATDDVVAPFAITPTAYAGNPLPGITGSLTLGGTSIPILSWEVKMSNGLQAHDNECFQQYATGYHEGKRRVTGKLTLRAENEHIKLLGARADLGSVAAVITIGNTAGQRLVIDLPAIEYGHEDVGEGDTAGGEARTISLPFKSLASSSAAADELKLSFT